MNEGLAIFLNLNPGESDENEALIRRIDELLLNFGVEYTGVSNMYRAVEKEDRDHAIFVARNVLRETVWLKDKLAGTSIMNLTNVCSVDQIRLENMAEPSARKLEYYEKYYQESHTLAHGIVIDENGQLRDGYTSYILSKKYGICPDVYEAFAKQPLKKIVVGQHVSKDGDTWKVKGDRLYRWKYTLKSPVVPGDILKVRTKKGRAFIYVRSIEYAAGNEFCKEHRNVIKHMKESLQPVG